MNWDHVKKMYDYLYNKGIIHMQSEFAEKTKIAEGTLSNCLDTDKKVSPSTLLKISRAFPNVFRTDWVLTGIGEMLKETEKPQEAIKSSEVIDDKDLTIQVLREDNKWLRSKIDERDNQFSQVISDLNRQISELKNLLQSKPRSYSLDMEDTPPHYANDDISIYDNIPQK